MKKSQSLFRIINREEKKILRGQGREMDYNSLNCGLIHEDNTQINKNKSHSDSTFVFQSYQASYMHIIPCSWSVRHDPLPESHVAYDKPALGIDTIICVAVPYPTGTTTSELVSFTLSRAAEVKKVKNNYKWRYQSNKSILLSQHYQIYSSFVNADTVK